MLEGLYTILEQRNNFLVLKLTDKKHPIFKAHFPSYPLLPGFLIIDIFAHILKHKIIYIKKGKFINPIFPNDILICHYTQNHKKVDIKIVRNQEKISEISYESE